MKAIQEQYYVKNALSAKLFIEAMVDRTDPVSCVEKILGSPYGTGALQASIRIDLTPSFFNTSTSSLLNYLQAPNLRNVGGGDYLRRIVRTLVDPPTFWYAFLETHIRGQLDEESKHGFAWLLFTMMSLSTSLDPSHRLVAEDPESCASSTVGWEAVPTCSAAVAAAAASMALALALVMQGFLVDGPAVVASAARRRFLLVVAVVAVVVVCSASESSLSGRSTLFLSSM